jgi:hypothetical protein
MKITAFWDIPPCSLVEVDGRFRGAFCFYHQGDEVNRCLHFQKKANAHCAKFYSLLIALRLANNAFYLICSAVLQCV